MTFRPYALVLVCLLLTGCAKNYFPSECDALDPEFFTETSDPLETVNRAVFNFNLVLDKNLINPVVQVYQKTASPGVQSAVRSFNNNIKEPRNIAAALMMGEFNGAAESSIRLLLNSTFGIFGLFDLSGLAGIPYKDYDFGQVLGRWGIGSGAYIVLPVFGPTTLRDLAGTAVHTSNTYVPSNIGDTDTRTFVQLTTELDDRVQIQPLMRLLDEQMNPYLFVRESYRQTRLNEVCYP